MAVLHLLRHGQHGLLGGVLAGRMPGVGLSERGCAEIAVIAERLAGENVTALYSSPLQRTRESAEIIGERLGLPVTYADGLIELDFGEWTGATFDSIRADPRWRSWSSHRSLAAIPGGETMRAVQHRAVNAIIDICERHPEETVVAVSHGDVIRAALVFALGMPLDFYHRIEIVQGSLSTIRIDDGGIRVLRVNEKPPLE